METIDTPKSLKIELTNLNMDYQRDSCKYIKYDIAHTLRCHSKDNNPQDSSTRVNDIAFEIDSTRWSSPRRSPSSLRHDHTNLFATCGANIVNLIDASTGKIEQRFTDNALKNGTKDIFSRLAWTKLTCSKSSCSLLTVAGLHGHIKVLAPRLGACVLRIDAHEHQVDSLLFHPVHANVLVSGSCDRRCEIWQLHTDPLMDASTDLASLNFSYTHLGTIVLDTQLARTEHVLTMTFVSDDNLLISTTHGNYCVRLDDASLFEPIESQSQGVRLPAIENGNDQDAVRNFLTSRQADEQTSGSKQWVAKRIKIKHNGLVANDMKENENSCLIINKLYYLDGKLIGDIINTNSIYVFDFVPSKSELIVSKIFTISEEISAPNTDFCLFKDANKYYGVKTTEIGCFFKFELNLNKSEAKEEAASVVKYKSVKGLMKFKIPDDFVIKMRKTMRRIMVDKNYGFDKTRVLSCACNVNYLVCTTDQNMVFVWSKANN